MRRNSRSAPGLPTVSWVILASSWTFVAIQPLIVVAQALIQLGLAGFLHTIGGTRAVGLIAELAPGDRVYKGIALSTLTRIEPAGLAVSEPLGSWLHTQWPGLFASPSVVRADSWINAVVGSGSTLLAELLVRLGGQAVVSGCGAVLMLAPGLRPGWIKLVGILLIAQGVLGLGRVVLTMSPRDFEVAGLAHVAHMLSYRLGWVSMESAFQVASLALGSAATLVVLLCGVAGWLLGRRRGVFIFQGSHSGMRPFRARGVARANLILLWATTMALASAPVWAEDHITRVQAQPYLPESQNPAATVVKIEGEPFNYRYLVNGEPQIIRSVGYNAAYRGHDAAWREPRYDRDFAMIRSVGFNTILGWDEREFDELTLDKAHRHGLGVIWPYDFPYDGAYEDPTFRAEQRQRVLGFVARYAQHPALRMWGLGSEVIWGLGGPANPRAQAFAQFLAELVEEVHQLDPDHPVVYRDSEDVYIQPIRDALRSRGEEQPWMVYGANVYTFRLAELMADWPKADFRVPLFISEYSPTGFAPAERAAALAAMTQSIEQRGEYVLGGSVYAWTTQGADVIDRVYGLVDASGLPVDGALDGLRRAYGN